MRITKSWPLIAALLVAAANLSAQVTIRVDASKRGADISPTHYGIFFEDINHAADGGLYAELVRNRSFEDDSFYGGGDPEQPTAWRRVGRATLALVQAGLLNEAQHNALCLTIKKAGDGIANEGFWGMKVTKGDSYRLSLFAKGAAGYRTTLTAALVSKSGKQLGTATIKVEGDGQWKRYSAEMVATGSDEKGELRLTADRPGQLLIDVVSLFPPTFKNRPNGMRPDLAQMLADLRPRFMRFPGGCFVEGYDTPDNAFRWKRTIGPIEQRSYHPNLWGYPTSNGIGFHEYLQLAEDLGAKPLFVVNVGIWHGGCTPYEKIDEWIEECLDALEYANGDVTTKYGRMRAEAGHPAPFGLEYIEIGNENYNFYMSDNRDQSDHYPERYIQFYRAIKAKYPNVKCIGNVESWSTDSPSWRNGYPVDIVDEHYYRTPQWFADRFSKYDTYPRDGHKVYVGEYAVTGGFGKLGNLNAALGEAVYMMGMENNSDVVVMNSYAPIFVNENDVRWQPDMIRFNSAHAMGTPSYYVQQMFPNHLGNRVLKTDCIYKLSMPPATPADEEELVRVGVGTWSTQAQFRNARLTIDGKEVPTASFGKWERVGGRWKTGGSTLAQTSHEQPALALVPKAFAKKGHKYSFSVEACKSDGPEGFLLLFDYKKSRSFGWYNVGGWGNEQNNVEQSLSGGKVSLSKGSSCTIESGRWYTLRVEVEGDKVRCYIDDRLDQSCTLRPDSPMSGVFASTTVDDAAKCLFVKVVNVGAGSETATIRLANCRVDSGAAEPIELLTLASGDGNDENSLQNPTAIVPRKGEAKALSHDAVSFHLSPYSVNIVTIKIRRPEP